MEGLKISKIAGKHFVLLSNHQIKFWTGEVLEPSSPELVKKSSLKDFSEVKSTDGTFELVSFEKRLTEEAISLFKEIVENKDVDYILVPALFSTLVEKPESSGIINIPRGKMVAFNATAETQRLSPQEKIASNKLTPIW